MQYYREPGQHTQEATNEFYFNSYNYPNVSSTTNNFRQQDFPVFSACREEHDLKTTKSACQDDSPTLRSLLSKEKKQEDCSFYKPEESGEYSKLDMLLSPPSSERSSDSEPVTKPPNEQAQFYPWMKSHHGNSFLIFFSFS